MKTEARQLPVWTFGVFIFLTVGILSILRQRLGLDGTNAFLFIVGASLAIGLLGRMVLKATNTRLR